MAGAATSASATPLAFDYGPKPCVVIVGVSPPSVGHGGTISVKLSGDCFTDTFTVVVKGRTLGNIVTDAAGTGSGTFALPCAVNVGRHMVVAVDAIGNSGSAPLAVTPAPCASAPGHAKSGGTGPGRKRVPRTNSDLRLAGVHASAGVPAGAAAVGLLGLLILGGRKRRQGRGGRAAESGQPAP
jgi:hypothetical protein